MPQFIKSALIYALTILFSPIALALVSEWKWAIAAFLLNLTGVGMPIASAIAVWKVHGYRNPEPTRKNVLTYSA